MQNRITCIVKEIARKAGIDKAIAYSSGSRIVSGLAGVFAIFFISLFLTGVEQGFYFTFGSILALQVFFELGLTGIMTQYVSYEASHLVLDDETLKYKGEEKYKSRLASLVQFCVKWYAIIAIVALTVLLIVGFVYFNRFGEEGTAVDWKLPWLLICIGTAIKLFQSPFNSIFMGLGMVKEMSEVGFYQQLITPIVTFGGLALGIKLSVTGIAYIASVILWQVYVHKKKYYQILVNLYKEKITEKVSYLKEIFPYQWRIALSWVSSYFIYQFFNPVLFATEGAIVAGQMGMTLQALNAIQSFAMSWINTKIPMMSRQIAQCEYKALDISFKKTLKQMFVICSLLVIVFLAFIGILNLTRFELRDTALSERFLGFIPLVLLSITSILNLFIYSWATYLRCHKKEPFLIASVCTGIANGLSTLVLGNMYGLYGIVIGYLSITIIFFIWGNSIFRRKKLEWH